MTNNILKEFYSNLFDNRKIHTMRLCHSSSYNVRAGILADATASEEVKDLVSNMDIESFEDILYSEGMMAYNTYGISKWYADKWLK